MTDNKEKKPEWLKVKYNGAAVREVAEMMKGMGLNTVCREANCPNIGECFASRTATFMILGDKCTRDCRFCSVAHGLPLPPDPDEPPSVAKAVKKLGLGHAVVTMVTRDDLPDGGAGHFAAIIDEIRRVNPNITVEALISDLKGDERSIDVMLEARPDILGHNVETISRLYSSVRLGAEYERSLGVLRYAKEKRPDIYTKTGFMVGLGETDDEIMSLLRDVRKTGCDIVTIGQYLRPSEAHVPLDRYVTPEQFSKYEIQAKKLGFTGVVSSPLARSSYHAAKSFSETANN